MAMCAGVSGPNMLCQSANAFGIATVTVLPAHRLSQSTLITIKRLARGNPAARPPAARPPAARAPAGRSSARSAGRLSSGARLCVVVHVEVGHGVRVDPVAQCGEQQL